MAQKPSIPKGTRDFIPGEMKRREYIFDTIKSVFKQYGYQPIETPAMENLSTLLGKYGEEGDKLLFKILNSGDFIDKIPSSNLENPNSNSIAPFISEKGLRYDLTVPFARFVVQHRNEITFPFKRYQIQPVWRADKPQKGRYREFFQCDVDVIGSDSLLNEAELVRIIDDVFGKLRIGHTIKLNNRKVLYGIAESIGETDRFTALTVAVDKLAKIGMEKVKEELGAAGINDPGIKRIEEILSFEGTTLETFGFLDRHLAGSETGEKGMEEIKSVFQLLEQFSVQTNVEFDLTLARGLNYYTGAIFEVVANDVAIGSICGGGRYDDLTGIFGMEGISGVGISFGADRIYDVLLELDLFPESTGATTQVLFVNFGEDEQRHCLPLLNALRESGIPSEIYPEPAKMKKQMTYANNNRIPLVVLIGETEMNTGTLTVKDMRSGEQTSLKNLQELTTLVNTHRDG
jgi:histidyl-tRNA synthetase